ncbi:MAG TPA: hypothetical protein VIP46_03035 [Pyrinomonadaceae bacterium]
MTIRGDHLALFVTLAVGASCLCASYLTARKGKGLATFASMFFGLLALLIAAFVYVISSSMPD